MKAGLEKLSVRGLVAIGGDGSLSIAQQLFEGGVRSSACPRPSTTTWRGTDDLRLRLRGGLRHRRTGPAAHAPQKATTA